MEAQLAIVPTDLPEDIHTEILLRLPAKSVLRFRSVCKAWCRITTDPYFLAAHARLRPAGVLLCTYLNSTGCRNRPLGCAIDVVLDLLLVSGEQAGRRRLVHYHKCLTTTTDPLQWWPPHCLLLGSCDGILLLEKEGGFYLLCNPVTRQWAELPRLPKHNYFSPTAVREYAFYFHMSSGEYRLLYRRRTSTGA
ncbi:hypothetical protein BAE44_0023950 [Dichanthelium oligosanthes]|uniref:F-box domain-containing protein n=1 Tax=Dichanthelium oligosanthes TaxID=888268 RepID=A0A1E5UQ87_9POAL|nr:hypothetical protein BAE44_0023950 [Dichanthelium oligosanthes]